MYADVADPTTRDYYGSVSLDRPRGRPPRRGPRRPRAPRADARPVHQRQRSRGARRYPNAIHSHGSAGPLRGMKLSMYEGGLSRPGRGPLAGPRQAGERVRRAGRLLRHPADPLRRGRGRPPAEPTLDGVERPAAARRQAVERPVPLHWQYRQRPGRPVAGRAAARALEAPGRRRPQAIRPLRRGRRRFRIERSRCGSIPRSLRSFPRGVGAKVPTDRSMNLERLALCSQRES